MGTNCCYYPHVAGYVQSYTEIRMEQMVLDLKLKPHNIKRVWVDGIYIKVNSYDVKSLEQKYPEWHVGLVSPQHEIFEFESELKYQCVEPVYFSNTYENRLDPLSRSKIIVKGVGGTGKSYLLRQLYSQCPNALLLVPTNELKKRFEGTNVETIDMVKVRSHLYQKYSTILMDEYGIISQETLDKLIDKINPDLLVLGGDEGQLRLIKGTPINESNFDILVLEKIFRQYDPEFQRKLNRLRKTGKFEFNQKVDSKTAINKKYIILSATIKERDRLNKLGFALNESKDNQGIKVGSPVRFYKTTKNYNAGETGVITSIDTNVTIKKKNDIEVKISVDQFKKYHKLAYSMTYHCVQGKTVSDKNIAINTTDLFDKQMKYVGCSRVVREDQLFLLVG